MSIRKAIVMSLVAPAFAAGTAHAAEIGPYFGASVGQTTAKADVKALVSDGEGGTVQDTFHFDKQEAGYQVYGGYNFLPWLGVEAGYVDFGNPSDHATTLAGDGLNGQADLTGWQAFAVGTLPLGPVDAFVKAGAIAADFKLKIHGSALATNLNAKDNENEFAYGGGVSYSFGKFSLRAEADGYDTNKLKDLYLISAGLTYHI
jgi:Outer membrane protein beta-barrel domain